MIKRNIIIPAKLRFALCCVIAISASSCSDEAEFSNGARARGGDSDAMQGGLPGAGSDLDPSRNQVDESGNSKWEPFFFTRTDAVVERSDVSTRIVPAFGQVEETVTMKVRPPSRAEFRQAVRSNIVDSFVQGHDGAVRTETFAVSRAGLLDILVVVDNSTSMEEEQANLSQKLAALTSAIDDTNWQLGVINMSSPCLRLGRVIRRNDADRDHMPPVAVQG